MQIFPREINLLGKVVATVAFLGLVATVFVFWYYFSPKNLQVGYAPKQPVPYSHRLHAGELGIDCRYCHSNVEEAAHAVIPPTQTCMGCHAVIKTESKRLEPVRASWESGEPIRWVRVHRLPDHSYFNHASHVNVGVGCVSCHGRIDKMEVVYQAEPVGMGWCLDCHRNPEPNLRPVAEVTNMDWVRPADWSPDLSAVNPPEHCSGCHR